MDILWQPRRKEVTRYLWGDFSTSHKDWKELVRKQTSWSSLWGCISEDAVKVKLNNRINKHIVAEPCGAEHVENWWSQSWDWGEMHTKASCSTSLDLHGTWDTDKLLNLKKNCSEWIASANLKFLNIFIISWSFEVKKKIVMLMWEIPDISNNEEMCETVQKDE